jgi:hypothetical protein
MMNNAEDMDDSAFIMLDFKGDNLDPTPLLSLLPLVPVRPKKKGDPVGPTRNGRTPTAKTGYCGFTTDGKVQSKNSTDHAEFLLKVIDERINNIREIMSTHSLTWRAVLFEGNSDGRYFSDLSPELLRRAAELGLPLLRKGEEAMTIVVDAGQSQPC